MEHIGDALREFLKAAHLDQRIADCQPVIAWERIVGPEVAAHARAIRLQRGILWVEVSGSSWMQHIGFLKPRILEALKREFPDARIKDLRCVPGAPRSS
ncbi:MAG: DUF721 domain-containing protein [Candidatus Eisenbacteria bacterium]|nr:DUF721 domain-containing protein [Candidatus Eisenbacteria bacterium]